MVHKSVQQERRPRGRPRGYDPQVALTKAIEAFWKTGFSGTSLDDLSAAMDLNRPSLYAGFGDKRSLYLKSLAHYWRLGLQAMDEALAQDRLPEALMDVYERALSIYFSGKGHARGCFAIGTAATEAVGDPVIRACFAEGLRRIDESFEARFRAALDSRELPDNADIATLATLSSAVLYSLAIRARAGTPRPELRKFALKAVDHILAGVSLRR